MAIDAKGGPSSSCAKPAWNLTTSSTLGDSQLVNAVSALWSSLNQSNDFTADPLTITPLPNAASAVTAVCYSPSGQVFAMSASAVGVWSRGVPVNAAGTGWNIALTAQGTAATNYQIIIGPNGLPNFVVP
jgi:hypothetical protein